MKMLIVVSTKRKYLSLQNWKRFRKINVVDPITQNSIDKINRKLTIFCRYHFEITNC